MDLKSVRSGNYLQHSGKLVEVNKVDFRKDKVFVDDSSEYLLHYEVLPVSLDNKIKYDLSLNTFPEEFIEQFYELVFGEDLYLHDVQNTF